MAEKNSLELDSTDEAILRELQSDARISMTELAKRVAMSASAATERVRRLEEAGVIESYQAKVNPEAVGYAVMAFVRLRYPTSKYDPFYALLEDIPEIAEAHHITGEDCFILKVNATSMKDLERITGRIGQLGGVTSNIVYSSPLPHRPVTPPQGE